MIDFIPLLEQAGLRVLDGHMRCNIALGMNQHLMAVDANGTVFRIAVEGDNLVVAEQPDEKPEGGMLIVNLVEGGPLDPSAQAD